MNDLAQTMNPENFRRLYDQVLDSFLAGNPNMVRNSNVNEVLSTTVLWRGGYGFSRVYLYDCIICGYIYLNGPSGAGMTRCRILEALENCTQLKPILERKKLKVMSLGGGLLNDVVGFLSAMSHCDFKSKMYIRVVASPLWRDIVRKSAELLREGNFGDVSDHIHKVKEISFVGETLPSSALPGLHRYGIVIIYKLVSNFESPGQRFELVQVRFLLLLLLLLQG